MVLLALVFANRAGANHIAGGTYTGALGGGSITFSVAADGSRVVNFVATNISGTVPGSGVRCVLSATIPSSAMAGTRNHTFDDDFQSANGVRIVVDGRFPSAGNARGTVQLLTAGCETEAGRAWTATAQAASPSPTATPTTVPTPVPTGVPTPFPTPTFPPTAAPLPLPVTGSHTPIYGFTGMGLVFLGLSLVVLTHRPRSASANGSPLVGKGWQDGPQYEADYFLSGWIPQPRRFR